MMLFLSHDLEAILRWLRKMFLKDNILEKAVTPFKMVKIDVKKTGNQRLIEQVTIWIYFFIFGRFDNWPMHKLILFGGLYALIYIQKFMLAYINCHFETYSFNFSFRPDRNNIYVLLLKISWLLGTKFSWFFFCFFHVGFTLYCVCLIQLLILVISYMQNTVSKSLRIRSNPALLRSQLKKITIWSWFAKTWFDCW